MNDTKIKVMEATVNAINHLLANNNFVRDNDYSIVNPNFMNCSVSIFYIAELELVRVIVLHHSAEDDKEERSYDVPYETMDDILNNIATFLSTVDDEYIANQ